MARMGASTRVKRSAVPAFWRQPRKMYKFSVRSSAGPHSKIWSYPLLVLLRDVLHVVRNAREGVSVLREGKVLVDGTPRTRPDYPIGLMDVVQIPSVGKVYRLLPHSSYALYPVVVPETERSLKLCVVKSKVSVKSGKIQVGFHDGRTVRLDSSSGIRGNDACLVDLASNKILSVFKLEKGSSALCVKGGKAGLIGMVEGLKPGTITRPATIVLSFDGDTVELPAGFVMPLGKGKPPLTVTQEA